MGHCEIPGSVTGIWKSAFMHVDGLTGITIPTSVTTIGWGAFFGSGLTQITLPASVTSIDSDVFTDCGLKAITVDGANASYCSIDGVLYNKDKSMLVSYPNSRAGSYEIPDGVVNIAKAAFNRCFSLTTITVPASVTNIENGAFSQCNGLTKMYFKGNAPQMDRGGGTGRYFGDVFCGVKNATIYYRPGTKGWDKTFGGRPTAVWEGQEQEPSATGGVGR